MSTWSFLIRTNITSKYRSSRPVEFCEKGVVRNFAKSIKKRLGQSPFLTNLQAKGTLLKKRLWHMCFPVNFAKFLRTSFLQNTSGGCF